MQDKKWWQIEVSSADTDSIIHRVIASASPGQSYFVLLLLSTLIAS